MKGIDAAIQRGIEAAVNRWANETLPGLVDDVVGKNLPPDAPRTQAQFIWWMARFFAHTDRTMKTAEALDLARRTLAQYLADERIAYGDPRYSWTGDDAEIVAREMETDHWESRP